MLDVKFLFKSKDITATHRYFRITIRHTFHSVYKTTRSNTFIRFLETIPAYRSIRVSPSTPRILSVIANENYI